jgi:hypothetical protein
VTISDSIPIQFWINGVETFNEKAVCSIHDVCFCLPFNDDDEITIQFEDSSYSNYYLSVYTSEEFVKSIAFTEIATDTWELSFVPSEHGITGRQYQFKITSGTVLLVDNTDFTATLSPWLDSGAGPAIWEYSSNSAVVTINSLDSESNNLYQDINQGQKGSYSVTVVSRNSLSARESSISLFFVKVGFGIVGSYTFSETSSSLTSHSSVINVSNAVGFDRVLIAATWVSGAEFDVIIDSVEFEPYELASSDCIDIKASHDCTTLINYTNSKVLNGIDYNTSPPVEFNIRIPAVFFLERFPDEHEEIDLSNSRMVRLVNQVKAQKLLDIGFMPFYMHKKLQLILSHDTIEIDGESWLKTEPYEIAEGNKRYPLRKAQVWLTDKNYIVRNVL